MTTKKIATPEEILTHMQLDMSQLTDSYNDWRLGQKVFSLGCTERKRITLYYQQVRAFNLVYALKKEGHLLPDTKICILGAGPAGVAAASAAATLGADVVLLEKDADILGVLGTKCNKRRLFHPTLDQWPSKEWNRNTADLPLYNWEQTGQSETSPDILRTKFEEELEKIRAFPHNKLGIFTEYKGQPEWKNSQWSVDLSQGKEWPPISAGKSAKITPFDAEILILAFGFGGDKKSVYPESFGYFEDDAEIWDKIDKLGAQTPSSGLIPVQAIADHLNKTGAQSQSAEGEAEDTNDRELAIAETPSCTEPQIIVSGSGDGALIEAINVVFHSSTVGGERIRENSLNWLFPDLVNLFGGIHAGWEDLLVELQNLEELIDGPNFNSSEMLSRYKQLEDCVQHKQILTKVDEQLKSVFEAQRKVYLFHKDLHYMAAGNFAFLRFLVWRLVSMGWIIPRRIEMTSEIYNIWRDSLHGQPSCNLEFTSSGLKWVFPDIHFIIPRHGPNWPFGENSDNYPHLLEAAKKLQKLNTQDKTREVIWDDIFTNSLKKI